MKLRIKPAQARGPTLHLGASYLGAMLAVSITFSIIFYMASSNALHFNTFQRQVPGAVYTQSDAARLPALPSPARVLQAQTNVIRRRLVVRLVGLNASVLVVGGTISYYLARRTLRPIEQAMDAQQQFFSNASHELKTPLSALHLRGEVALRNPKLTLAEAKAAIASNVEQAMKLERLSHDLLRLAAAGQVQSDMQQLALAAVIADAMQQVGEAARVKSIRIVGKAAGPTIYTDAQKLTQVLVIILDNAIKYSPPNTVVRIGAHQVGKEVVLGVHDQGPGISAADLPHIFERFYQGDPSRKREGFGLGLAIAAAIMHQLHGSIRATSSPSGATFTMHIPAAQRR